MHSDMTVSQEMTKKRDRKGHWTFEIDDFRYARHVKCPSLMHMCLLKVCTYLVAREGLILYLHENSSFIIDRYHREDHDGLIL